MGKTLQSLYDAANAEANAIKNSKVEFIERATLPAGDEGFLEVPKWFRVRNVACCFVDMVGSSQIDYSNHPKTSCKIYQGFVGNLVRIWKAFGASYFDLKGDGGFALFDGDNAMVRSFLAAETFRSWVNLYFNAKVSEMTNANVTIQSRSSLHLGTVDVKRIGLRGTGNQNHVWLNSTINQASKLLGVAMSSDEELVASQAAYDLLGAADRIKWSCGCGSSGNKRSLLWKYAPTEELEAVGLEGAWHLKSFWCSRHGSKYLDDIMSQYGITLENTRGQAAA